MIGGPPFVPVRLLDAELSEPFAAVAAGTTRDGIAFGRARVLVKLHGWPMGLLDLALGDGPIDAGAVDAALDPETAARISRHLAADGLTADGPHRVGATGIAERPACLEARRTVLAAPPTVSVVVPTIDRPEALRRTLIGLREQDLAAGEVIVVDNAPDTSGAGAVVLELQPGFPALRRVEEPRRGASRARNRGLAAATAEIVAFLDGDARPDRSWLAALVTAITAPGPDGELPACATGAILPDDLETEPQLWMEEWGGYWKGFERRTFRLRDRGAVGPMFPFAIAVCGSGASMAFRRGELAALGGFDAALGPGSPARSAEDLAAFLDLIAAGRTIVYEPGAIVWHEQPRTEERFRATLRAYGVGLTAYLARHLAAHPRDTLALAAAMPAATLHLLRPGSARNRRRSASFPSGTLRDEASGMLRGPLAYARGRRRIRRERGLPPGGRAASSAR